MVHSICINQQNTITVELDETYEDKIDYVKECLDNGDFINDKNSYTYKNTDKVKFDRILNWVIDFFNKEFGNENVDVCDAARNNLQSIEYNNEFFNKALINGQKIKEENTHSPDIPDSFQRQLMDYQKMSVEHLIRVGNAANFSVPGSGKTTIAYAAIARWLEDNKVEKVFVIGPTASFLPWEEEYNKCFGKKPRSIRISGDSSNIFHEWGSSYDLFLMHFNTAMNRQIELKKFMDQWKTVLIIDESHYIKNSDLGRWSQMAIDIAPHAKRRIALSGTPMPNDARDLWTQMTFLWPHNYPLDKRPVYASYAKRNGIGKYETDLAKLFCRIKKNELNLPEPKWIKESIDLGPKQRHIYDAIATKTLKDFEEMSMIAQSQLQKFRMGKLIRLLQTASNPTLLNEMSSTFNVAGDEFAEAYGLAPVLDKLPNIDSALMDEIRNYTNYEIPSKIVRASTLTKKLVDKGEKVIIWSTFVHNMYVFQNSTLHDMDPIIINGTVPTKGDGIQTRDVLLNKFKNSDSMVLIATPASLAESVSLHKNLKGKNVCNNAIYLDRNFNGAQYMQSMDRIHRIGMDESVEVKYHLLIANDTIDEVINNRLNEKHENMLDALNDNTLKSLDNNPIPRQINDGEFEKDYQEVIKNLKATYGYKL